MNASNLSDKINLEYLFKGLIQAFPELKNVTVWNSDLSQTSLFKTFADLKKKLRVIQLCACNIGDNFAFQISSLEFSCLEQIRLLSNPISNRGVNLLIKMELPLLKILLLDDTNITSDIFKSFKKLVSPNMVSFDLS